MSVCYAGGYSLPSIHKRDEMEFIRKWMQTLHIYRYMPRSEAQDIFNQIFYTYIGKTPLYKLVAVRFTYVNLIAYCKSC